MIIIDVINITKKNNYYKNINKHKNILIIGPATTDYKLNEIEYYDSLEIVKNLYGEDNDLYNSFKIAKNFNVENVFLANVKTKTEYINILNIIIQYDFSFIVPLGIKFSDYFIDKTTNMKIYYSFLFLKYLNNSLSTVIFTDFHASCYENRNNYLIDMNSKVDTFKSLSNGLLQYGNNILFVLNNLKDYIYSNLIVACLLSNYNYIKYPYINFGESYFYIDKRDISNEIIYFKDNILKNNSIENLINFYNISNPLKLVLVDIVIKYISRELNFSEFEGKFYNKYVELQIYNKLKKFLDNLIEQKIITNYKIDSIEFKKSSNIGYGTIYNIFEIIPNNTLEYYKLVLEM